MTERETKGLCATRFFVSQPVSFSKLSLVLNHPKKEIKKNLFFFFFKSKKKKKKYATTNVYFYDKQGI
jgi:hypothetical protein